MASAYCLAWNAYAPYAVAAFYAENARLVINNDKPIVGRGSIAAVAIYFYAQFPDLEFRMLDLRSSGTKTVFSWEWSGTYSETGRTCAISGWDEWTLSSKFRITESFSWFDAADYHRQVHGTD